MDETYNEDDVRRLIAGAYRAGLIQGAGGIGSERLCAYNIKQLSEDFADEQIARWNELRKPSKAWWELL